MHSTNGPGDYVPIQIDPRAPLDDADPVEEEVPGLTAAQVEYPLNHVTFFLQN